uniref:Uncharacterized protein n=1 Tax=Timspurckia oligopyrenoides TaxID=708627 RepID=A0A7S1EQV2_9RHOD|mmetsp:Transcript_12766/g.22949  ORF Transcript_12766/g.22949 Transcript_12766/m.22949 type:complete len:400 (+) Transcript_12766:300-1499(+)
MSPTATVSRSGRVISRPDINGVYDASAVATPAPVSHARRSKTGSAGAKASSKSSTGKKHAAASPGSSVSSDAPQSASHNPEQASDGNLNVISGDKARVSPLRSRKRSLEKSAIRNDGNRVRSIRAASESEEKSILEQNVILNDDWDLLSDEESEVRRFVADNFVVKPVQRPFPGGADVVSEGLSTRERIASTRGISQSDIAIAVPAGRQRLGELPFWNVQHRKLIRVQLDSEHAASDVALIGMDNHEIGNDTKTVPSGSNNECSERSWRWSAAGYPFRLYGRFDPRAETALVAGIGGTGVAFTGSERRKRLAGTLAGGPVGGSVIGSAGIEKRSARGRELRSNLGKGGHRGGDDAAGERREAMGRRFTPHNSRKGWVVCRECKTDVWPPNCRKHLSICK